MAKKQTESHKVPAVAEDKVMRHARIELPDEDYQRLKGGADRYRISVSAYIRMAVMERIERDESKGSKS